MTKTVNGVPYVEDVVPKSKWNIKCPFLMVAKKVTLHNTDNEMEAEKEARYHHTNNYEISFHLVFDEKEGRQLLPFNRNGWHSGDGLNGYGNRNTIAAEIARNYDRTRRTTNLLEPLQGYYTRAEQNAIKVIAQVMIDEGIVANNDNIKTHNDWNGKWCPSKILNEGRLQQVKNGIIAEYNRLKGIKTKPVAPKPTPQPSGTSYKEKGIFYPNDTIIVRDAPSTKNNIIARYYKGEKVTYHTVHLKNGYVWLQYNRSNGRQGYIPCRTYNNGKYGTLWGTIK